MQLQLIDGQFTSKEAFDIITQMVQVKIKFHEDRIQASTHEEDVKMREKKISFLQDQLMQLRQDIVSEGNSINVNTIININEPILVA